METLARKFHTLLAGGATECSEHYYAVEGRRGFRAYDKTARRFCFSPHELEMGGGVMKHQRSKGVQSHSECEKCGLAHPVAQSEGVCLLHVNESTNRYPRCERRTHLQFFGNPPVWCAGLLSQDECPLDLPPGRPAGLNDVINRSWILNAKPARHATSKAAAGRARYTRLPPILGLRKRCHSQRT